MEEFLKDSPSDYNTNSTTNSTTNITPSGNYMNYTNNTTNGGRNGEIDNDIANDANLMLGYGNGNGNNGGVNGNPIKYEDNYQYQQAATDNYLSPNQTFVDTSQPGSFQDAFLDDFDANTYNQNQNQPSHFSNFFNPSNNLDDLISPKNDVSNQFLNPQYFSPQNTSQFNNLNSIAEDNFSLAIGESLSGPGSYNDHRGVDILQGNHLSPAQAYISPNNYDNSYDTLRSPSFQGNYMNLPPQFSSLRSNIPIKQENLSNPNLSNPLISPNHTSLSPSRDSTSTKQLTKEEKLKRRRDFHNQVERRRRDLIKEKIKTLGQIVPASLLNPPLCAIQTLQAKSSTNSQELNDLISSIKVKETKPNKSTILNKSVDYINHLVYVIEKQEQAKKNLLKQIEDTQRGLASNDHLSGFHGNIGTNQDPNFNPDEFFLEIGEQKNYYN